MKTKIVSPFAGELQSEILEAQRKVNNLRENYPDVFAEKRSGVGRDLAVLTKNLQKAPKLVNLLT